MRDAPSKGTANPMMTFLAPFMLVLVAFAAQDTTPPQSDTKGKKALMLEEQDWKLRELNEQKLPEGLRLVPELRFSKGRISGNSGCNRMFAAYERSGDFLKFGMMGSTMMACADPNIEQPTLKALGKVAQYRVSEKGLELLSKDKKVLAWFVAK